MNGNGINGLRFISLNLTGFNKSISTIAKQKVQFMFSFGSEFGIDLIPLISWRVS